ncbi:MAG: hypothetical protein J1D77_05460 [Muribaculaceae bacterium]|nr:hypothetical protein [Muribaculaceae bacterium]
MDQLIVNIEPGANVAFLRKIIKNIKGIGDVVLKKDVKVQSKGKSMKKTDKKTEEWIRKMRELSNSIDSSMIDMNDERTRYIMSK